jgi:tetratricopeptide (TPR) repeat protein
VNSQQDELADLACALADRREVDWAALSASELRPDVRGQISAFELIARIAQTFDSTAPSTTERRPPGSHWGQLEIHELVGHGTYGDVYRARDARLDRDVALKLLRHNETPRTAGRDPDVVAEGRLLARVAHPNVVRVFGADYSDGQSGIWMELVEGVTLEDEILEKGPLNTAEATAVMLAVCNAVSAVHAAGLLHRDIKLQNIMRDHRDGRLVLMDFSAGRVAADPSKTGALAHTLAGSPAYLAPEVIAGSPATERSDVYSVGVVLFRLLSGRFPVDGESLDDVADAHEHGRRKSLRDIGVRVPRRLSAIVERALDADAIRRFPSADAMGRALAQSQRAGRRRSWWFAGASVGILASLTFAAAGWGGKYAGRSTAMPFEARDWVLVAGFENRTGNRAFDDVLGPALSRELLASGFVNVVPRARIEDTLALMEQPPNLQLDARTAREVSVRDGAVKALITGRIEQLGSSYLLTADIVNPADGLVMASITEAVPSVDALLMRVRAQGLRVREALGETLPAIPPGARLAKVTTPSLGALRLYTEAESLIEGEMWLPSPDKQSRYATAEGLLRRATEADPGFASAWLLRAQTLRGQMKPDAEALAIAERALVASAASTPIERCFIEGAVHRFRADAQSGRTADLEASARSFEALLRLSPDHYWGLLELAAVYRRLQRHDDAERVVLHAAAARPHSVKLGIERIRVLVGRRDPSANSLATRLLTRLGHESLLVGAVPGNCDPAALGCIEHDKAWLRLWRVADAWLAGDVTAALREIRRVDYEYAADRSGVWLNSLYGAYIGVGRFGEARQVVARMPPESASFYRARIEGALDDREAFDRAAGDLRPFARRNRLSFMLLWMGRLAEAESLAVERRQHPPEEFPVGWVEFEGQLRHAQRRYDEAIAILEPIARDAVVPRVRMNAVLADSKRHAGDLSGAIGTLAFTDRKAVAVMPVFSTYDWLRARVLLSELLRQAGRVAEAEQVATEVRHLLRVADANHPLFRRLQ